MLNFWTRRSRKKTLLTHFPAKSGYAESYRTLQANLQFSSLDREVKSVCVTSASEMEGKSNTVANLAYTMARNGKKVLMIDGDLRKPGLTQKFGMEDRPGLSELVARNFSTPADQGSISDISLRDLIRLKKLEKSTGVLSLSDKSNRVEISFHGGNLTNVFWKNRPVRKKLASTLIQDKRLKKSEAETALRRQKKSGQKLGTILIIMGLISREELKEYLTVHLVDAFKTAMSMYEGTFQFVPLPGSRVDTTIQQNVNFDRLFMDLFEDGHQTFFLAETIESAVTRTHTSNLYLLPSGQIAANPTKILNSEKLTFILEHLNQVFDFVIIDTPPAMPVSDIMVIAPQTDGILVVLKAKKLNKGYIKNVIKQLETGSTPVLGLILNCVDMNKDRYYRYHQKYNALYYGKTG